MERDLKGAEIEIKRLHEELSMKAPIEEIGKVWRNFQTFAEYKDFKALYNKVIPEMAKHEAHMQDHKDEISKFGEIVQRFDEIISNKASKSELKLFEQRVREEYLSSKMIEDVKNAGNMNITHISDR